MYLALCYFPYPYKEDPAISLMQVSSVPLNYMSKVTQLACGKGGPKICLHSISLPPRILNTRDLVTQGLGLRRDIRIKLQPIPIACAFGSGFLSPSTDTPFVGNSILEGIVAVFPSKWTFVFSWRRKKTLMLQLLFSHPSSNPPRNTQYSWISLQEVNASAWIVKCEESLFNQDFFPHCSLSVVLLFAIVWMGGMNKWHWAGNM